MALVKELDNSWLSYSGWFVQSQVTTSQSRLATPGPGFALTFTYLDMKYKRRSDLILHVTYNAFSLLEEKWQNTDHKYKRSSERVNERVEEGESIKGHDAQNCLRILYKWEISGYIWRELISILLAIIFLTAYTQLIISLVLLLVWHFYSERVLLLILHVNELIHSL